VLKNPTASAKRRENQGSQIMKKFYIEKAFKDIRYVVLTADQLLQIQMGST
jgi:hypothetical protein